MYCPQCQDEYRPGMTVCASCGVTLLSGSQMLEILERQANRAGRNTPITPEDQLVDILKGKVIQVKSLQTLLGREGIPSLIAGDSASCGKGCGGGADVRLQVRLTDVPDVMTVLNREHLQTTGLADHDTSLADAVFDPEAESATCPACGCTFATDNKTCPDCGLCF
jgi:hypothetical protein